MRFIVACVKILRKNTDIDRPDIGALRSADPNPRRQLPRRGSLDPIEEAALPSAGRYPLVVRSLQSLERHALLPSRVLLFRAEPDPADRFWAVAFPAGVALVCRRL